MFLDSKMRPRIVLRQAEQQVSIAKVLSACDKKATVWPHAARCGGSEAPSVLLCSGGGAGSAGPAARDYAGRSRNLGF